jgi:DNA-directed RNA polymerase specialized sigma24 family protein
MKNKNKKNSPRVPPPDIVGCVRESARNGAAYLLGRSRKDVLEEIGDITVEKYLEHMQKSSRPISNPRSWAFKVGRNEANAWVVREQRFVSLDAAHPNHDEENQSEGSFNRQEFLVSEKPFFGGQEEILEALPELFEWFQVRVVDQLHNEDRLFYERYYVDRWSEGQIASELKISHKAVIQRWRRLLFRMRRGLLRELPNWNRGQELFGEAFHDPKSLADLLCLIRLFVEQGIDAIRGIVESFKGK